MNRITQQNPNHNSIPPSAPPSTSIGQLEQLEQRTLMAAGYDLGVNINNSGSGIVDEGAAVLKQLGAKTVRVWIGVTDFNSRKVNGALRRAIDYSNAGFDVLAIINPTGGKMHSPSAVSGWFDWAAGNSAIRSAVDRWEIGNEVDHHSYWRGTLKQYVNNFLKPASIALREHGEPVVSAGPSWNPEDVREMIDEGMLNYVDYVGYHPYANGASMVKQRVREVVAIVDGRKPLVATEWNVRGYENDKAKWAEAVEEVFPTIRDNFELNYYFGLVNTNKTKAGPGGIMYSNGAKTSFFSALAAGMKSAVGAVVGNTPSALPSITKISVYNADTDQKILDSLKKGDVIDLTETGTRNLAFVATASTSTGSVKFTLNGDTTIDNSRTYAPFGDAWGNLKGEIMSAGTHSLTVTPYLKDDAAGKIGVTRKLEFTITNGAVASPMPRPTPTAPAKPGVVARPSVSGVSIVDAVTGKVIPGYGNISSNMTINLSKLPTRKIAIIAIGNGTTRSVELSARGKTMVENLAPFAFFGDVFGKLASWKAVKGTYAFRATAFAQLGATGAQGNTLQVKLTFK